MVIMSFVLILCSAVDFNFRVKRGLVMFWGYLWLVLKFSWLSILIIYLLYFVFGIIATKVNAKTQSDSSYVSLIGIKNDMSNTVFYAPIFIVLFAAGLSIHSNVVRWIIVVLMGLFILSDLIHMIIEIISLFATTKREKSHVLLYTFPALVALCIWALLGYDMFLNFNLVR